MSDLIYLKSNSVNIVLNLLLKDRTTEKNIVFATDVYDDIDFTMPITKNILFSDKVDVRTRVSKSMEEQTTRTRKKAEVFTPSWICNKMNNHCDAEWFGRENVFNVEQDHDWIPTEKPIEFPDGKSWRDYVDSKRLEIACGEAPYLVSRYDTVTGEMIPIHKRIGILDRKLRIINENTNIRKTWDKWVYRAFESVYGYEYQGDNLLIARINLLETFCEYTRDRWNEEPTDSSLKRIADIISWNLWQMNGIHGVVPCISTVCEQKEEPESHQMTMFDVLEITDESKPVDVQLKTIDCKIYDWREDKSITYKSMKQDKVMKFDFVIGNPPYQLSTEVNNRAKPIYPYFYDDAEEISERYMLISPARFLFNAGLTSKEWNKKMLSDEHLKVEYFNQNSAEVFSNTDIKGGVAVVYRDSKKDFGAIEQFVSDENLRGIIKHFSKKENNLPSIMFGGRSDLKFNDRFLEKYPHTKEDRLKAIQKKHPNVKKLGTNEEYELKSPTLDVLDYAFKESVDDSSKYYRILGLVGGKREYRYIEREYMTPRYPDNNNIEKWKVFIPKASGNGQFGETISTPVVSKPGESSTPTFISIGAFDTEEEAQNVIKYIKTKTARALLSVLKITQDIVPSKWAYVPLQDFTNNSDIDWNSTIEQIDRQLYKKYNLNQHEIDFIERNVKEME